MCSPKIYFSSVTIQLIPFIHFALPSAPSPLITTTLFSVSMHLFLFGFFMFSFYIPHMSKIKRYLSFSNLISLSINTLKVHVVTNGKISSFLWLSSILLCVCVCVCVCVWVCEWQRGDRGSERERERSRKIGRVISDG